MAASFDGWIAQVNVLNLPRLNFFLRVLQVLSRLLPDYQEHWRRAHRVVLASLDHLLEAATQSVRQGNVGQAIAIFSAMIKNDLAEQIARVRPECVRRSKNVALGGRKT